ncbi:ArsR family transcriptional regulator [Halobacteriales archaeon QS_4_69_34]|nr:MAG: ArsR family transcriptional regulator [Halobacteriales archaeon QS_4_69_34]
MERALWYLFAGTRGGANRARIVRSLTERPKNANQLAEDVGLAYNTVRHHLDSLTDHGVLEPGTEGYGALYFTTEEFEHHRGTFEEIVEGMD